MDSKVHRRARRCGWLAMLVLVAAGGPVVAQDEPKDAEPAKTEPAKDEPAKDEPAKTERHSHVRLRTSMGDIVIELFDDKAPLSVENFLQYVRDGFYDGVAFHRVKAGFMIQTGGYNGNLSERTNGLRPPIKNESANLLKNERGTVAMARMGDPHSATSQFFINVVDNPHLDRSKRQPYGYAVFGKVVEGMDVVDRIQNAPTIQHPKDPRGGADGAVNPNPPITIKEATIVDAPAGDAKPAEPQAAAPPAADDQPAASAEPAATPEPEPTAEPEPSAAPDDGGEAPE